MLFISGCKNDNYHIKSSELPTVNVNIFRYEDDLMNIRGENFSSEIINLSDTYSVFLGNLHEDTTGIYLIHNFVEDSTIQKIYEKTTAVFDNSDDISNQFEKSFSHIKFYYQDFMTPDIFTYISGFDYSSPVIYTGDKIIIAIDMYLGADYIPYYELGIPRYIISKFDKNYLVRDCIEDIAIEKNASSNAYTNLINLMIYYGKNLEFIKRMMPDVNDTIVTGYTAEQLQWCKKHEKDLWNYLISDDLLFSNDLQLIKKLVDEAPFTSIISHDAPGAVCRWIGWKIVASYCKNNNVTVEELMQTTDAMQILNKSGYRP